MRPSDHAFDDAFCEEYLFAAHRHPTTILCSELLLRVAGERKLGRVLDVGTGDGCLALVAADLGAERVIAVERDRSQLSQALGSVVRSGLQSRVEARHCDVATLVPEVDGEFDVVLANLWGDELVAQAPVLARLLAAGGSLIVSGTLLWQAGAVRAAFESAGLRVQGMHASSGWAAMRLGHAEV